MSDNKEAERTWTMCGITRPNYQENYQDWCKVDAIISTLRVLDKEGGDFLHIL